MKHALVLLFIALPSVAHAQTIDWVAQQAYLKASNTGSGDAFGFSVAASGNTVVVAAIEDDSSASGVDGDGNNDSLPHSGAAYVFVRASSVWTQQAYLKASTPGLGDSFGVSISMSGDTIVVGAPYESSDATGVNGDQLNDGAGSSGAVYVFVRSGTTWTQQAYLKASNTESSDHFGTSVSISGDTIVVGAPLEDSGATGVNGDQSNESVMWSGAAYVFVRSGTTWSQQAYLKASNVGPYRFGAASSVSGDTIVVGAVLERSDATGVNGDQTDEGPAMQMAGAAYVFVRNGTTWRQQAYLKASNTQAYDKFGYAVSVHSDTILVGAPWEDSSATGVNGDQSSNLALDSGAAYVFVRSGPIWAQQAYLKASNTGGGLPGWSGDEFGHSFSLSGEAAVIGAWAEDSPATSVNGTEGDDPGFAESGAAYAFARNGTSWNQTAYLKASNTSGGDELGRAVALSGSLVVVGAAQENSRAVGVNGNQMNEGFDDAGASYVFDLETPFLPGCFPGTHGVIACPCGQPPNPSGGCRNFGAGATAGAVLNAEGNASLAADTIVLTTSNHPTAPPGGIFNVFFTGSGSMSQGFASHAGVRCVSANVKRLYYGSTTAGVLSRPGAGDPSVSARSAAVGAAIAPGEARHYFNVYRDPAASIGCGNSASVSNLTNAGTITWSP